MKKPINIKSILIFSTLSVFIISLFVSNKKIDFSIGDNLLFHNGPIITMDIDRPSAESVYIENGIIRSNLEIIGIGRFILSISIILIHLFQLYIIMET